MASIDDLTDSMSNLGTPDDSPKGSPKMGKRKARAKRGKEKKSASSKKNKKAEAAALASKISPNGAPIPSIYAPDLIEMILVSCVRILNFFILILGLQVTT